MPSLEQIQKDIASFELMRKSNPSATIYAEKYLEDVKFLVSLLKGPAAASPKTAIPNPAKEAETKPVGLPGVAKRKGKKKSSE